MDHVTRYAKSGDVHIAYQVLGDGPRDLVAVPGAWSHLDLIWEEPSWARYNERLASFARVILFDKRGTGLSDRVSDIPTLEQRMDDVRAVMDAAGSGHAAIVGVSEGGPMSALFAATYPDRTDALVLYGTFARMTAAQGYPWRPTTVESESMYEHLAAHWGEAATLPLFAPSQAHEEAFRQWGRKLERMGVSPGDLVKWARSLSDLDIRHVLQAIRVPTLVLHRSGDAAISVENGRYLAEHIPGAKFVELPGDDHFPFVGDHDALIDEIEEFLTGVRHRAEPDRVLATVLFVDIVDSTRRAAELGDRRWADLLSQYYVVVRRELAASRGREVNVAGDGVLATFDGPARAIRCALAIRQGVRGLGLEVRAGLHAGECELIGDSIGGIAIHIGSRVASTAQAGDVLVSSTVKDLVVGSGIGFTDRGAHSLKGVPGEWRLFSAQ
jgi:pimeloyl-ACP methyl ester carboxylesterase/class 3 adenylate cyclase